MLTAALGDAAQRGLIPATDIGWVVDLRRPARSAGRTPSGSAASRASDAMRDYQQAAIELGFLHHRYLRGTAARTSPRAARSYVARIDAVRPRHRLPRTGGARAMTTIPTRPTRSAPPTAAVTEPAHGTEMLTALVRLRGALQAGPAAARAARRRRAAHRLSRRWSTSSRTT